jgi:hypothetical protein
MIKISIAVENMLKEGTIQIDKRFVSETPWGLCMETVMERPREDKPVIFTHKIWIDSLKFKAWLEEHIYLLNGNVLIFGDAGLRMIVPGHGIKKYGDTMADIIVRYAEDVATEEDKSYRVELVKRPLTIAVHREVLSNHDWIVKCAVE